MKRQECLALAAKGVELAVRPLQIILVFALAFMVLVVIEEIAWLLQCH